MNDTYMDPWDYGEPNPLEALDLGGKDVDVAFSEAVQTELKAARDKFPGPNVNTVALLEEVGELAQALLHIREGKQVRWCGWWEEMLILLRLKARPSADWRRVWVEAVQVAVMAQRVATEGDPSLFNDRR